jgi:hypothetical protein
VTTVLVVGNHPQVRQSPELALPDLDDTEVITGLRS